MEIQYRWFCDTGAPTHQTSFQDIVSITLNVISELMLYDYLIAALIHQWLDVLMSIVTKNQLVMLEKLTIVVIWP